MTTKLDADNKENDGHKATMTTQNNTPRSNGNHGRTTKNQNKHYQKKNHQAHYSPHKNNFHQQHRGAMAGAHAGAYPGGLWQHVYGHPMPPVGYYNAAAAVSPATHLTHNNHAFPRAGLPSGGLYHYPYGYQDPNMMYHHARMTSSVANVVTPEASTLSAKAAPFVPKSLEAILTASATQNNDGTKGESLTQRKTNGATNTTEGGKILLADVEGSSTAVKKKKTRVRTKNNKNKNILDAPNTPKTANKKGITSPPGLSLPEPEALMEGNKLAVISPPRLEKTSKGTTSILRPPPGLGGVVDQVPSTAFLPTELLAATGPNYIEDDDDDARSVSGPKTDPNKKSNSPSPVTVAEFDEWAKSAVHHASSSAMENKTVRHDYSSAWGLGAKDSSNSKTKQNQVQAGPAPQKKKSAPWSGRSAVLEAVAPKPNHGGGNQRLWSNVAASTAPPPAAAVTPASWVQAAISGTAPAMIFDDDDEEDYKQGRSEGTKVTEEESDKEDSPFKVSPMDLIRQRHGIVFVNTPRKKKF